MARANPESDTETAPAEKPAETVTLAVGHPYDELVLHDTDGKPTGVVITSAGTEVPAKDEESLRAAAKDAGVPIRKVR